METCKCGFKRGDKITIVGWNKTGESGCWVSGMEHYIGRTDIVDDVDHDISGKYACTATLTRTPCIWQTEWLIKDGQYTLF